MSNSRIEISDKVLKWAIENGEGEPETILQRFNWIKKRKNPTLKQLEKFSNFIKIPFAYLLLSSPPKENIELVKFRTYKNKNYVPSRKLIDTINIMEARQAWMNDYRRENGQDIKLEFVNSEDLPKNDDNKVFEISERIRKMLHINEIHSKSDDNFFKDLRRNISNKGVLVMLNGVVANQNRRVLDVEEFRAFTIIDEISPLIFINNKDSNRAKIFSLVHEFVHLFFGIDELLNVDQFSNQIEQEERIINDITAKILMPIHELIEDYKEIKDIKKLSNKYHVSNLALAIELRHLNLISEGKVEKVKKETQDIVEKHKSSGGNYYNTQLLRIDHNFMYALTDATDSGYTSIGEASYLSCAPNSFNKLKQEFKMREGIPW